MKTDLPARIASVARIVARMDYQVHQLRAFVENDLGIGPGGADATHARKRLGLVRLRRDIALVELEQLRNELRLTLFASGIVGGRDAV